MIHFCLEGSFLYHCFFSWIPLANVSVQDVNDNKYYMTPHFLGHNDRVYGPQAGGDNPLAQLWMVYARADKRWAGSDLVRREVLLSYPRGALAEFDPLRAGSLTESALSYRASSAWSS